MARDEKSHAYINKFIFWLINGKIKLPTPQPTSKRLFLSFLSYNLIKSIKLMCLSRTKDIYFQQTQTSAVSIPARSSNSRIVQCLSLKKFVEFLL